MLVVAPAFSASPAGNAVAIDDTIATDTTFDAQTVLESVSDFLTPQNFGQIKTMGRTPDNHEAWSTIEYATDANVGNMVCDGFGWQYERVTKIRTDESAGEFVAEYIHTYNKRSYYITITRVSTGHDSMLIYVSVKDKQ